MSPYEVSVIKENKFRQKPRHRHAHSQMEMTVLRDSSNTELAQLQRSNGFYTISEQASQTYTLRMNHKTDSEHKLNKYRKSCLGHFLGNR